MASEIYYDPYDYELDANPHPMWKRMRDELPLYYNAKFDFFAVSRYQDVRELSVNWQTYSSAYGSVLELIDAGPEVLELARNMLFEDPPIHDLHRSVLARAFTPRRINDLEPHIRALCGEYLDAQVGSGGFDYVGELARKLPMMVIGMLLGVPEEDRDYLRTLADASVHRDEGDTEFATDAQAESMAYFGTQAERRKSEPADDLTTVLVEAEFDDEDAGTRRRLTDQELAQYLALVSAAGNETVTNLIGWTGKTLAAHPAERQKLVDDPSLIPNAIEELLRFEAPSPIQARVVMKDVELYGQTVKEGSKMALLTASANRDDRVYSTPDPDIFAVDRSFDHHMSFGHGVHFCLGAALARMEGRIALEETLKRFPIWDVDEANAEMVHTSTVRGWERLPIVF
jgi:cytochrome P450